MFVLVYLSSCLNLHNINVPRSVIRCIVRHTFNDNDMAQLLMDKTNSFPPPPGSLCDVAPHLSVAVTAPHRTIRPATHA